MGRGTLAPGDSVVALKEYHIRESDGYLSVRAADPLIVRYIGGSASHSPDEEGWIFAAHSSPPSPSAPSSAPPPSPSPPSSPLGAQGVGVGAERGRGEQRGWIQRELLSDALPRRALAAAAASASAPSGEPPRLAVARENVSSLREEGYLPVDVGEWIRVLHTEEHTAAHSERGWLYAEHVANPHVKGWIRDGFVLALPAAVLRTLRPLGLEGAPAALHSSPASASRPSKPKDEMPRVARLQGVNIRVRILHAADGWFFVRELGPGGTPGDEHWATIWQMCFYDGGARSADKPKEQAIVSGVSQQSGLRQSPDTGKSEIERPLLEPGVSLLTVLAVQGDWAKVEHEGCAGWLPLKYLLAPVPTSMLLSEVCAPSDIGKAAVSSPPMASEAHAEPAPEPSPEPSPKPSTSRRPEASPTATPPATPAPTPSGKRIAWAAIERPAATTPKTHAAVTAAAPSWAPQAWDDRIAVATTEVATASRATTAAAAPPKALPAATGPSKAPPWDGRIVAVTAEVATALTATLAVAAVAAAPPKAPPAAMAPSKAPPSSMAAALPVAAKAADEPGRPPQPAPGAAAAEVPTKASLLSWVPPPLAEGQSGPQAVPRLDLRPGCSPAPRPLAKEPPLPPPSKPCAEDAAPTPCPSRETNSVQKAALGAGPRVKEPPPSLAPPAAQPPDCRSGRKAPPPLWRPSASSPTSQLGGKAPPASMQTGAQTPVAPLAQTSSPAFAVVATAATACTAYQGSAVHGQTSGGTTGIGVAATSAAAPGPSTASQVSSAAVFSPTYQSFALHGQAPGCPTGGAVAAAATSVVDGVQSSAMAAATWPETRGAAQRSSSVGAVLRAPAGDEEFRQRSSSVGPAQRPAPLALGAPQHAVGGSGGCGAGGVMGVVSLVTFGLEKLDPELYGLVHDQGGGARAWIPDEDLRVAMQRKGFRAHVIVDVRAFPDPDCLSLRGHTGYHHEIIARLVRHQNFRRWLAKLKADFDRSASAARASAQGAGGWHLADLGVALYCKSGKHRSVAGAIIMRHILLEEGWSCPDMRHLSQNLWGRRCCGGLCEECRKPPASLQESLAWAYEVWKTLPTAGERGGDEAVRSRWW